MCKFFYKFVFSVILQASALFATSQLLISLIAIFIFSHVGKS